MERAILTATVAAALLLGTVRHGRCQNQSSSFASSAFDSGGFGTIGAGTTRFGVGFGTSNFGGGGFGASAFGGSGLGGGVFGFSGPSIGGFGQSGFGFGQGPVFVGRDAGDMQSLFNNLERGSSQFFRQLGRTLDRGQRRNRSVDQPVESGGPTVRVQYRMALDESTPASAASAADIRARVERLLADHGDLGKPSVQMDDGVVTLRGTAPTASRRLVIEKLVSLEPGVTEVRNQMTIAPTAGEPTPPATDN